jgi:hypothetical protein
LLAFIKKFIKDKIKSRKFILDINPLDHEYFLERQYLYYLSKFIKDGDDANLNIVLTYFVKKYFIVNPDPYIITELMRLIKTSTKLNKEITHLFPITYFDDMSSDIINIDDCFMFKIFNDNKKIIDQGSVTKPKNEFTKKGNSNNFILLKKDKQKILKSFKYNTTLQIFNTKFSFDDTGIICEYTDTNGLIYKITIKNNAIGNNKSIGLNGLLNDIFTDLKNKDNKDNKKIITFSETKFIINDSPIVVFSDKDKFSTLLSTNMNKFKEIMIVLVLGSKRFGDWIQMQMSKDLYFYLKTNDLLCKLYGILIGAPTFIPIYLLEGTEKINGDENPDCGIPLMYFCSKNPLINVASQSYSRAISASLVSEPYNHSQYRIEHPIHIDTPDSRVFFTKYLKYKQKYLEQKIN